MTEYILSIDFNKFIFFAVIAIVGQLLFCRKIIISIFDPLAFYLFNNSFSIAFVIYLFVDGEINNEAYLFSFIACNLGFLVGVNTAAKIQKKSKIIRDIDSSSKTRYNSNLLYTLLFIILAILLVANISLILQTGQLPLISSNAESAKVTLRQDGLGIIYRINDALLPLALSIVLLKIFPPIPIVSPFSKNNFVLLSVLTVLILIFISGGSKGAIISLLGILVPCQLLNQHFRSEHTRVINQIMFTLLPLGILLAFFVLLNSFNEVKYLDPFQGLMVRLVASGDAFYYFYKYDLINKFHLNFFNFIVDSLNPLLSILKITSYDTAIGEKLLIESINLTTGGFGPNASHPVYGLMYFGYIGSVIFSTFVGCTISIIRTRLLFWSLENSDEIKMVVYIVCFYQAITISIDYVTFVSTFYTSLLFAIPVFICSKLFTIKNSLISR